MRKRSQETNAQRDNQIVTRRKKGVLGGKTVRAFTVLNPTRGAIGLTREFNSTGKVVLSVEFTDRTGGIAIISVP